MDGGRRRRSRPACLCQAHGTAEARSRPSTERRGATLAAHMKNPGGSAAPARSDGLVRVMGTFGLAAAIVNMTIGGGIFRLPANVASSLGAGAPVAYLVCAVAM